MKESIAGLKELKRGGIIKKAFQKTNVAFGPGNDL